MVTTEYNIQLRTLSPSMYGNTSHWNTNIYTSHWNTNIYTSHWNTKIYTTPHHNTALLLELLFLATTISGKNPSRFTNTLSMGNEECLENFSKMKNLLKGKLHNPKFISSRGL